MIWPPPSQKFYTLILNDLPLILYVHHHFSPLGKSQTSGNLDQSFTPLNQYTKNTDIF